VSADSDAFAAALAELGLAPDKPVPDGEILALMAEHFPLLLCAFHRKGAGRHSRNEAAPISQLR
jgi:hypothetical protein